MQNLPLQKLVAETTMLDGLLTCLEIRLVGSLARLQPGNMLWGRDCLGGCTILPITNARRAAIASHLTTLLGRRWRRRHLYNVGKGAWSKIIFVAMAVTATLAMVFLSLLNQGSSQRWKGVRVVR